MVKIVVLYKCSKKQTRSCKSKCELMNKLINYHPKEMEKNVRFIKK